MGVLDRLVAFFRHEAAGWRDALARVVVLQAVAANLGGMITPVGNPQNLFIFTAYDLSILDFFAALMPFGAAAFALLAAACAAMGRQRANVALKVDASAIDMRRFALHLVLFAASVLAVVRLLPYQVLLAVTASVLLAGFTDNWHSLLIGVDLGGLGTPIASLASLIAFRMYLHTDGARVGAFLREFAVANVVALVVMVALYAVLFVWR